MTGGETAAVVLGAVAVTGVVVYLVYEHNKSKAAIIQPRVMAAAPSGQGIAGIISQFGGAAAAQLGKQAGSALGDWISEL